MKSLHNGSIPSSSMPAESMSIPVNAEGTFAPSSHANAVGKQALNSHQLHQAHQRIQHDYCKGLRGCWYGVVNFLGASTISTALAALLPMIYLGGGLIYANQSIVTEVKIWLGPSVGVVAALTFFFGLLCWISLHCKFQNMLYFTVWTYRALGDWSLISCIIFILAGWSWNITTYFFQIILASFFPPAFIYLFCAAVIDAHRLKMIKDIEIASSVQDATS